MVVDKLKIYNLLRLTCLGTGSAIGVDEAKEKLAKENIFTGSRDELISIIKNTQALDVRTSATNDIYFVVKPLEDISQMYSVFKKNNKVVKPDSDIGINQDIIPENTQHQAQKAVQHQRPQRRVF